MPDAPIVKAEQSETGLIKRCTNPDVFISKETSLVPSGGNPVKSGEKWVPQNMTYLVCDDVIRF